MTAAYRQRLEALLAEPAPGPSTDGSPVDSAPSHDAPTDEALTHESLHADPALEGASLEDDSPGPRRSCGHSHRDDLSGAQSPPVIGAAPGRWTVRLPSSVAGVQRSHLSAMAVLLALVLAGCGVWLLRSRPVSTVEATPSPASGVTVGVAVAGAGAGDPASATGTAAASSTAPAAPPAASQNPTPQNVAAAVPGNAPAAAPSASAMRVHVTGKVERPGVHELDPGSRVIDAVAAAGGLAAGAHPGSLNMAEPVCDGCQVVIPASGEGRLVAPGGGRSGHGDTTAAQPRSGPATHGSATVAPPHLVDLNTADRAALESLDGVGPVMAGRILDWRTAHGRFSRVEELQEVEGVGPKTFARLKGLVRVS